MTAAEWFVDGLKKRGVEWIATLCGHGLDPLFQAAKSAGLRLVDTRNEQTAAYIADAYGRLTRRPGVCAASSGVAHVNALTGVANSYFDGAPMLLVSGAGDLRTKGMGHFQEMDQVAIAQPITRYAGIIDRVERTLKILEEALTAASGPPPGPVHITFPLDVQVAEAGQLIRSNPRPSPPPPESADQVALAVARARRPLIVAGSGVYYGGGGEALLQFSERYSVPLVVPIWDRGSVDRPVDTFLGVIGAATGGPRLIEDADCVVMAGAVSDYRVGFLKTGVRMEGNWESLQAAYDNRGGRNHTAWFEEARRRREEFRTSVRQRAEEQSRAGMHAVHIIDALAEVAEDVVLLIDAGSVGQWAHQLLTNRYPGHWLTCGRSGVVGWGIGGAMGARLAYPGRPVILLSGDGAFTFNVADLECAVRQSLPFVAIVADDRAWGITRTGHLQKFGEAIGSDLGPIAFDRLAESLGARGVRIERPEQLGAAIRKAIEEPKVNVLHVPIVGGNPC